MGDGLLYRGVARTTESLPLRHGPRATGHAPSSSPQDGRRGLGITPNRQSSNDDVWASPLVAFLTHFLTLTSGSHMRMPRWPVHFHQVRLNDVIMILWCVRRHPLFVHALQLKCHRFIIIEKVFPCLTLDSHSAIAMTYRSPKILLSGGGVGQVWDSGFRGYFRFSCLIYYLPFCERWQLMCLMVSVI